MPLWIPIKFLMTDLTQHLCINLSRMLLIYRLDLLRSFRLFQFLPFSLMSAYKVNGVTSTQKTGKEHELFFTGNSTRPPSLLASTRYVDLPSWDMPSFIFMTCFKVTINHIRRTNT